MPLRGLAQGMKYLLHKDQDLSLHPQHSLKKLGVQLTPITPALWDKDRQVQGDRWPVSLEETERFMLSERPCLKIYSIETIEEDVLVSTSGFHICPRWQEHLNPCAQARSHTYTCALMLTRALHGSQNMPETVMACSKPPILLFGLPGAKSAQPYGCVPDQHLAFERPLLDMWGSLTLPQLAECKLHQAREVSCSLLSPDTLDVTKGACPYANHL